MSFIESRLAWARPHPFIPLAKCSWLVAFAALVGCSAGATAQLPPTNDPPQYGPYNGNFLADGTDLEIPITNTHDIHCSPSRAVGR